MKKTAIVLGLTGIWIYMSGVDQDRWIEVLLGITVVLAGAGVHKIGEVLEERREKQEELKEKRRNAVFAAWMENQIK